MGGRDSCVATGGWSAGVVTCVSGVAVGCGWSLPRVTVGVGGATCVASGVVDPRGAGSRLAVAGGGVTCVVSGVVGPRGVGSRLAVAGGAGARFSGCVTAVALAASGWAIAPRASTVGWTCVRLAIVRV